MFFLSVYNLEKILFSIQLFNLFSYTDTSIHNTLLLSTDASFSPGTADKLIILQTDEADEERTSSLSSSSFLFHRVVLDFIRIIFPVLPVIYIYLGKRGTNY